MPPMARATSDGQMVASGSAVAREGEDRGGDPGLLILHARRLPPGCAAFTEGNFRVLHRARSTSFGGRVRRALRRAHGAPGRHQLVDEFGAELVGDRRVGGSPAPTVDLDRVLVVQVPSGTRPTVDPTLGPRPHRGPVQQVAATLQARERSPSVIVAVMTGRRGVRRVPWTTVVPVLGILVLVPTWPTKPGGPVLVLVALVLAAAVPAAVHHAEVISHRVGEPFGALVLAVAVTVIEVGLIVTLMVAGGDSTATLARDTVFAAVMLTCNGIVGLSLLAATVRGGEATFSSEGIGGRGGDGADPGDAQPRRARRSPPARPAATSPRSSSRSPPSRRSCCTSCSCGSRPSCTRTTSCSPTSRRPRAAGGRPRPA